MPKIYSPDMGKEICYKIATSSKTLKDLIKENPHWPCRSTILDWRRELEDFRIMYYKARQDQIESFIDDLIQIADDKSNDYRIEGGKVVFDSSHVKRADLQIRTRQWLASKLYPRIYGDSLYPDPTKKEIRPEDALKELDKL